MTKQDALTKTLAVIGTLLAWLPLFAPVVFSILFLLRSGKFHFDYLMPAELSPVVLAGGLALTWAAFRAKSYQKLTAWSLAAAVVCLVGSQLLAVITGLADGTTQPEGLPWAAVMVLLGIYILAVLVIAVVGILLTRKLFKRPANPAA